MSNIIIGKFGEAKVIVSTLMPHDQIWISPKEEEQFVRLFELLDAKDKMLTLQEHMAKPLLLVNSAAAKYVGRGNGEDS